MLMDVSDHIGYIEVSNIFFDYLIKRVNKKQYREGIIFSGVAPHVEA